MGEGEVAVNTYHTDNNNEPLPDDIQTINLEGVDIASSTVDRFWYIDPKNSTLEITLTFDSVDIKGNEIDKNDLKLLYYNDTEWVLDTLGEYNDWNSYTTNINKATWYTLTSKSPLDSKNELYHNNANKLELFPNPTSNIISFLLKDNIQDLQIEIFDLYGKKVLGKFKRNSKEITRIDVSKLKESLYLLKVTQGKNKIYISKFIKI